VIWIAAAACLVAVALWLARRDSRRPLSDGGISIPALLCLRSLASIYHNINNLILVLPAFVFLWFGAGGQRSPRRWSQIAGFQAVLVFDVPTRLNGAVPRGTLAAFFVEHGDRLVVLACFVDVAIAWLRVTAHDVSDVAPRLQPTDWNAAHQTLGSEAGDPVRPRRENPQHEARFKIDVGVALQGGQVRPERPHLRT